MTGSPATRMHHVAYVVKDQEVTRRFYEDVVGLPLPPVGVAKQPTTRPPCEAYGRYNPHWLNVIGQTTNRASSP